MMSDADKKTAILFFLFFGILAAFVFSVQLIALHKQKTVLAYNDAFEADFYDRLDREGIEILSERRYAVESENGSYLGGMRRETEVFQDVYGSDFHHEFELYDPTIEYTFTEELSHLPKGEMQITVDHISRYREQAQVYFENFELIRSIVEKHGGEAECISGYDPEYMKYYFLLIYLPNAAAMIAANDDLHDEIYGGYVDEHVHNGIKVTIPRFLFCSDRDTYDQMKKNIDAARQYIRGRSYVCNNSVMTQEDVDLERVCNILLGPLQEKYRVTHVPDANTLGSPVCKNYLQSLGSTDYIVLHELEIGISYYLTVYEIE